VREQIQGIFKDELGALNVLWSALRGDRVAISVASTKNAPKSTYPPPADGLRIAIL
jgi:hypothetical protein